MQSAQLVEALYIRYRSPLLAVIGRYVRCPNEREDVLHDVFLRVQRSLPGFRGDSALYTWLYRIAINTSINHVRSFGYRSVLLKKDEDEYVPQLPDIDDPESLAIAAESAERVAAVMAQLEWTSKDAFLLSSRVGLSYESIADLLDCPIGTVRSRIFRTRENLRRSIELV